MIAGVSTVGVLAVVGAVGGAVYYRSRSGAGSASGGAAGGGGGVGAGGGASGSNATHATHATNATNSTTNVGLSGMGGAPSGRLSGEDVPPDINDDLPVPLGSAANSSASISEPAGPSSSRTGLLLSTAHISQVSSNIDDEKTSPDVREVAIELPPLGSPAAPVAHIATIS